MSDHDDEADDLAEQFLEDYEDYEEEANKSEQKINYLGEEEMKLANILLYGSPSAKQEVLVKLIYMGNANSLTRVLNAFNDNEYNRIVPSA